MAFRYPSSTNVFSISWESTGMIVSATRDPAAFKLARYIQYVETKNRIFRYLKLDLDEPARIPTQQEFAWAPGQNAPTGDNVGAFQYVDTSTLKYAFPWTLPEESVDQAEWQIEKSQMGIVAQKAMTNRTISTATLAQTASNWPSTNTDTANNLNAGAGSWPTASDDPADVKFLAIRKSLVKAATIAVQQTNAVMKWADLNLVISPNLANKMGNSAEIYNYTKGSPDAYGRQVGEEKYLKRGDYNMCAEYASVAIVVEDAVKVTSRPNIATPTVGTGGTRAWVWADASPVLMARKGGITGQFGGVALSTIQLYHYRNMETYTRHDVNNERHEGRIVDDFVVVLPFGQSGFLITSAM